MYVLPVVSLAFDAIPFSLGSVGGLRTRTIVR